MNGKAIEPVRVPVAIAIEVLAFGRAAEECFCRPGQNRELPLQYRPVIDAPFRKFWEVS